MVFLWSFVGCPQAPGHRADPRTTDTRTDPSPPAGGDRCNGRDDDHDGRVDEDPDRIFYADADGDGFGASGSGVATCRAGEGWASVPGDCDDTDPALADALDPTLHYTDVSAAAGFDALGAAWDGRPQCLRDRLAGGAAVADLNGDGHDDVFLPRTGLPHQVLFSDGAGRFSVDELALPPIRGNGALPVDLEGDGDLDLVVSTVGPESVQVLVNDGAGHFTEEGAARGLGVGDGEGACGDWFGVSAADIDGDDDLDVLIAGWEDGLQLGRRPRSRLFRNDGTGHFADATVAVGLHATWDRAAFGGLFVDVDGDVDPDLLLVADWNGTTTFRNDHGVFVEQPDDGVFTDDNGMGADLGDPDGDGDFDWFVTSIWSEPLAGCPSNPASTCSGNRLYGNVGGRWRDVTEAAGVRRGQWDWGTAFFDLDLDGAQDLVLTGGFDNALHRDEPGRLFHNRGDGTYEDWTCRAGFLWRGAGRGVVPFDPDEDGDQDLLVTGRTEPPALLVLDGPARPALHLGLRQPGANPFAVGAVVRVYPEAAGPGQVALIHANPAYVSARGPFVHLGLDGHEGPIDRVEVTWPDGGRTTFRDVAAGRVVLSR